MNDKLYVILPYFNFVGYKSAERNLNIFLKNFKSYTNAELIIVEGFIDENFQLEDFSDRIFKHLKIKLHDVLWVKENLINIGFSNLENWQYGCWIDRDIQFSNPDWALESIEKLKNCDILQPFTECIYLDKNFEFSEENNGFFLKKIEESSRITSFCNWLRNKEMQKAGNVLGHAGHVWAINKNFFDKIGGLCDKCIIGGGDCFLAQAIRQNYNHIYYKHLGKIYKDYCEKLKDARVSYTNGLILHRFHGDLNERNYAKRFEIFHKRQFNVETDLEYKDEILCLSENGKKFKKEIREYFISRNEDSVVRNNL